MEKRGSLTIKIDDEIFEWWKILHIYKRDTLLYLSLKTTFTQKGSHNGCEYIGEKEGQICE